jgi:histidinol-phosphate/aromatic aminotransferase/cobyric acid decarboxylase-like protein
MPTCACHCKFCRSPGTSHCRSTAHGCIGVPPARVLSAVPAVPDPGVIAATLARLKAASGSHSPSVGDIERSLPGVVQIDACFLSNPYATDDVLRRLRSLPADTLERIVAHYPSQNASVAATLARHVGVDADSLYVANGACEAIQRLLCSASGPLLLSVPTFSAYYEFAAGPVVEHRLRAVNGFRLDLEALEGKVRRHRPDTVVIITPNNPDGAPVDHDELVAFLERTRGCVSQVIVDESFAAFSSEERPPTLAPRVADFPHLVVVNSLSKSHGIAGLRLGYAVMAPERVRRMRDTQLWNINAFAEWFCELLDDRDYQQAYEASRRRYVRDTRRLFDKLAALPAVRSFPSAANFALLELDRPAAPVATELVARHGVYVRDCADKRGLDGQRYLRVASRTGSQNDRIVLALANVLGKPADRPAVPVAA